MRAGYINALIINDRECFVILNSCCKCTTAISSADIFRGLYFISNKLSLIVETDHEIVGICGSFKSCIIDFVCRMIIRSFFLVEIDFDLMINANIVLFCESGRHYIIAFTFTNFGCRRKQLCSKVTLLIICANSVLIEENCALHLMLNQSCG